MTSHKASSRLLSNAAILSLRMVVTTAISFYASRLVLQALGVTSFGIYNVVCGVTALMTFVCNSLTEGINRFIMVEVGSHDDGRIRRIFALSQTALALVALLFLLCAETLGLYLFFQLSIPNESRSAAFWVYQLSVMGMAVAFSGIPYIAVIMAFERFGFYGIANVAESLLRLAVISVLFVLPGPERLIGYGAGLLLIALLLRVVYGVYVYRLSPGLRLRLSFDWQGLRQLCGFTGYKLLWECADACGSQGVNIVLNLFCGPVINAARGIAFQVQNLIYRLLLNLQMPLRPQILKTYSSDHGYFQRLVLLGTKVSFYLMTLVIVPIILCGRFLLSWWLGEYPEATVLIVAFMCIESLVYLSFMPLEAALDACGDIRRYKVVQSLLYILVLPGAWLLLQAGLPYWTPFLLAVLIQLLILGWRAWSICPKVGIPIRRVCLIVPLQALVFSISMMVGGGMQCIFDEHMSQLLIVMCSTVLCSSVLMYLLCLDASERQIVTRLFHRFFSR